MYIAPGHGPDTCKRQVSQDRAKAVSAEPDWSPVAQCTFYYNAEFILDIPERIEKALVNKYIGYMGVDHLWQESRIRNDVAPIHVEALGV